MNKNVSYFLRHIKSTPKISLEGAVFASEMLQTKKKVIRIIHNRTSFFPPNDTNF